jgi:hypothetical protein
MHLEEEQAEDGSWKELAPDHVQWRASVLAVLNLQVLLPETYAVSKMDHRETGCEGAR